MRAIYQDLGEAFKTKDNFIQRGMHDLTGIVNEHLSIDNLFKYKKPKNLTDSGSEIADAAIQIQQEEMESAA